MPLVLSLRVGQDFYVGEEQVTIKKIIAQSRFEVAVTSSGRTYEVSDQEATELRELPDVYLSAGDRPQAGLARVAIDAPREIPILRGEALRNPKETEVEYAKQGSRWA